MDKVAQEVLGNTDQDLSFPKWHAKQEVEGGVSLSTTPHYQTYCPSKKQKQAQNTSYTARNMAQTDKHFIGKGTYTSATQSPWHESNNYYHAHTSNHNVEPAIKPYNIAKKTATTKNMESRLSKVEEAPKESDGEDSSNSANKDELMSSATSSQASSSDTMSESDLSESDQQFHWMGIWNMNGGMGLLELEKVEVCGNCIQRITQRN